MRALEASATEGQTSSARVIHHWTRARVSRISLLTRKSVWDAPNSTVAPISSLPRGTLASSPAHSECTTIPVWACIRPLDDMPLCISLSGFPSTAWIASSHARTRFSAVNGCASSRSDVAYAITAGGHFKQWLMNKATKPPGANRPSTTTTPASCWKAT